MSKKRGGKMPLLDHIKEFRSRLLKAILGIFLFAIIGWFFYNEIITTLAQPVCDLKAAQDLGADQCGALYINGVLGPLNLQIKVALLTGVILSAPIWLYHLWAFIAPALHRREKRNSVFFIVAATPFFAAGAFLGYTILPIAVEVLFGFTPESLNNLVKFDDYLDFVLRLILFVGLAFELPIFLLTFNLIGFLRGKTILKPWRIWIFTIFFFVAALSPTADPLSMILLSAPLILFYFMAGVIALFVDKKRDKKLEMVETGSISIDAPTSIKE